MIRQIRNLGWGILRLINIGSPVQLMLDSWLREYGWFKIFNAKESINKQGEPIPWYTYSSIKFIEPRLNKHFEVFEFGCGNSTFWYAERVKSIISVLHNRSWFRTISKQIPKNAFCIH